MFEPGWWAFVNGRAPTPARGRPLRVSESPRGTPRGHEDPPTLILTRSCCCSPITLSAGLAAADLELPRPSPFAKVTQDVGLTTIAVDYSSPGVKGRKIWGGLVPYDKLWRTGANRATKISFSRDVTFAGEAGAGRHLRPLHDPDQGGLDRHPQQARRSGRARARTTSRTRICSARRLSRRRRRSASG